MKPRLIILNLVAFLAVQSYASAGGVSAGLFNSPKGFGICVDYVASDIIYNSYSVYADCYGMLSGTYRNPGVKACYLHYNRLACLNCYPCKLPFLFSSFIAVFLHEKRTIDPTGDRQVTLFFQLFIEPLNDFVCIGLGNSQFLCHIVYCHKKIHFTHHLPSQGKNPSNH